MVFVDESIHDGLGFVVTAMVVAGPEIEAEVAKALEESGLVPGVDEFKSGAPMAADPRMRRARESILEIAATGTKIAILISPAADRHRLGQEVLRALETVARRNGLGCAGLCVVLDQGMFRSRALADAALASAQFEGDVAIEPEQDSRRRLGLQVADAVAHTVAQILRQELAQQKKTVTLGSESGYAGGTEVELGWVFLMHLRYAFFTRPLAYSHLGDAIDSGRNPIVIGPDDDPVEIGQHPDLLGWGVLLADTVEAQVKAAAEAVFTKIWLGCTH
ncbi:MAG: hypothetical protein ABSD56_06565 [Bryobacteraceae bacterium]